MLEFANVSVELGGARMLDDVNLRLSTGETVGVRGPSAAGKSTLLRAVLGFVPVTSGAVKVGGIAVTPTTASAIRAKVAWLPQTPLLGAPTVAEALRLPLEFRALQHLADRFNDADCQGMLVRLGLPVDILQRPAAELSGGEAQRVCIARALLLGADLILADEPTSALDVANRDTVAEAVLNRGAAVLSVSHDEAWLRKCNRIVEMSAGRIESPNFQLPPSQTQLPNSRVD